MIIGVKEENGVDSMVKQTFVNLPVEDLERTMAFSAGSGSNSTRSSLMRMQRA
jgi:predicted lactoylglutathione lyase